MDDTEVHTIIQQLKDDSITALDLSFSLLGQSSLLQILSALESNTSVTELYLQKCYLGPEGTSSLCNIIKKRRNLRVIDIRNNHLTYTELKKICRALENNFSVIEVLIDESLGDSKDVPFQIYMNTTSHPEHINETNWGIFTRREFERIKDRILEIVNVNKKTHEVR